MLLQWNSKALVLLWCCVLSAGIGRTGCFIASSICCQQLRETGQVDILETVCQLRLDRWGRLKVIWFGCSYTSLLKNVVQMSAKSEYFLALCCSSLWPVWLTDGVPFSVSPPAGELTTGSQWGSDHERSKSNSPTCSLMISGGKIRRSSLNWWSLKKILLEDLLFIFHWKPHMNGSWCFRYHQVP